VVRLGQLIGRFSDLLTEHGFASFEDFEKTEQRGKTKTLMEGIQLTS